jgi:hypothetical protein
MKLSYFWTLAAGATAIIILTISPVTAAEIPLNEENKLVISNILTDIQMKGEYVSDQEQYEVANYPIDLRDADWKGDCEDWAIAYKNALADVFPEHTAALKIMLLKRWNRTEQIDEMHAALFIKTDRAIYVAEGPAYGKKGKIISRIKRLRATQYSKKRILGELQYLKQEGQGSLEQVILPKSGISD